jgi:HlyD family secretion protein
MKNLKTWITLLLLVASIGAYGAYAMLKPGPAVAAAKVRSGTIDAMVTERAETSLPMVHRLTMPFDGRIEPISIEPGTVVAAGDLVARMHTDELDTALAVAKADLARVEAELAVLADNALANTALTETKGWVATLATLGASAEQVIKAREDHAAFSDWWKEAEGKLRKQGAVADEQFRRAATDSSEAAVDLAVAKLNHQIVLAVQQIFQLGPKYVTDYLQLKTLQAAVLTAERKAAEARVAQAERDLARAEIKAPAAGVVLTRAVQSAQVLGAGTELLTIGDPAALQVRADLLSQDATRVRAGDIVHIHGVALGDVQLAGKVIRIDPQAFTKVSSLGVEQQRVRVDIAFDAGELERLAKTGADLAVGYRVQVDIVTDRAEDALIVPRLALFRGAGADAAEQRWAVYRVVAGKAELATVDLGLGNDRQVQITKGLSAGDILVVTPPKGLTAGAKVTPVLD